MLYRLKDVCFDYKLNQKKIRILDNFTLDVREGEFLALMGPSGSGKTSILNIMAGFLRPSSGKVFYKDVDLYDLDRSSIARYRNEDIGIVHQFFNLISDFNALENVMAPLLIAGTRRKEAMQLAEALLEEVGVLARASHYPAELSGGERQRVAIARALINESNVLLADEPTGNLDSVNSKETIDLFCRIHKKSTTIVIVTHDSSVAEKADRTIDLTKYLMPVLV